MKTKSLTTLLRLKIEEVQLAKNNLEPIKDNPTVVKDYLVNGTIFSRYSERRLKNARATVLQ